MDPITGAIVAGLSKFAEPAVKDAYEALKALIVRKLGPDAEVTKAVKALEASPGSAGRREVLTEEMKNAAADKDAELLRLAEVLGEKMRTLTGATQKVQQNVRGDHNVISGTGNITVNIDRQSGNGSC